MPVIHYNILFKYRSKKAKTKLNSSNRRTSTVKFYAGYLFGHIILAFCQSSTYSS